MVPAYSGSVALELDISKLWRSLKATPKDDTLKCSNAGLPQLADSVRADNRARTRHWSFKSVRHHGVPFLPLFYRGPR